jgi:regulator of nonsense transcripts 1
MTRLQVVLLARDTPPNHPAAKELGLDLALWQPLIMDRQFVDWLVKHPSDQVQKHRSGLRPGFGVTKP